MKKKKYEEAEDILSQVIHQAVRFYLNKLENRAKSKYSENKKFWKREKI